MKYTRQLLSKLLGISLSTLRRILDILEIKPDIEEVNAKGLPLFYYTLETKNILLTYVKLHRNKSANTLKRCCICKKTFDKSLMMGTRCVSCYVLRYCKPIIYGKNVWLRVINNLAINKAIEYLKSFKHSTN